MPYIVLSEEELSGLSDRSPRAVLADRDSANMTRAVLKLVANNLDVDHESYLALSSTSHF